MNVVRKEMPQSVRDFSCGATPDQLRSELNEVIRMSPSCESDTFFNQLYAGVDPLALVGHCVSGALKAGMHTPKVGAANLVLEEEIIAHMGKKWGYAEPCDGLLQPGGTTCNLVAMIIARNEALPGVKKLGLADALNGRRGYLYTSKESHYSVKKAAGVIGVGTANVRAIDVDERGRMSADALKKQLCADVEAGHVPIGVVATAGTTVRGAFDPLRAIRRAIDECGAANKVWLHVDGAWGAGVCLSEPRRKELLDGAELVDSVTWCLHKMIGAPIVCSALLVRRRDILVKHFSQAASYLFMSEDEILGASPAQKSLQCNRSNMALPLWTMWRGLGDRELARRVDYLYTLQAHAVARIERDTQLRLVDKPQCLNVCFEVIDKDATEICTRLRTERLALVGTSPFGERTIIRVIFSNHLHTTEAVDNFFDSCLKIAAELNPVALTFFLFK